MSANVESMAFARKVPWHGFGHNNGDALMTAHEAIEKAGLNWLVEAENMVLEDGTPTPFRAILRNTDRKIYGSVRERYETFQNFEMADFAELITDMHGQAIVEVAGALNEGSRVFMILKLSDLDVDFQFLTEQEKHDWYLFLRNTHDGSGALTAEPTAIRVVCCNTEAAAIGARNKQKGFVSIRHTSNMQDRIQDAQKSIGAVTAYAKLLDEAAEKMANAAFEEAEMVKLLDTLAPIPAERGKDKAIALRQDLTAHILGTPTVPKELKGTRWGVFQGVTEFFEHEKEGRFWGKTPEREKRMLTNFTPTGAVATARQKAWGLLSV